MPNAPDVALSSPLLSSLSCVCADASPRSHPISSRTSRTAVCSSVSPSSCRPPGKLICPLQRSDAFLARCMYSTSSVLSRAHTSSDRERRRWRVRAAWAADSDDAWRVSVSAPSTGGAAAAAAAVSLGAGRGVCACVCEATATAADEGGAESSPPRPRRALPSLLPAPPSAPSSPWVWVVRAHGRVGRVDGAGAG